MYKNKTLAISTPNLKKTKQALSKSMIEKQTVKSKLVQSIKSTKQQPKQYHIPTSRTNKQNGIKKIQTPNSKTMRYSDKYEQKKQFLSQSMVLAESTNHTTNHNSRVSCKAGLVSARNQLRNLLSIDEDVESNLVLQTPDMKDILQTLILNSIIQSQSCKISSLQNKIQQLTQQLQSQTQTYCKKYQNYQQTIQKLKQDIQNKSSVQSDSNKLQQASQQILILTRQSEALKKQVFNYRKDSVIIKKQLSTLKKTHQTISIQYQNTKNDLQNSKADLHEKSIWLTTLQFQNEQLLKQSQPNQLLIQLTQQKQKQRESYDYLLVKLNLIKRDNQIELQELRTKHSTEIKKLRQKLKKKNNNNNMKPKKKLEIRVDNSDDSIDWNLDQEEPQTQIIGY